MLKLRPYKNCDAQYIVKWIKDEVALRQWSADRYGAYPITADNINAHYEKEDDNDTFWAMTAFDESGVIGHFIMRFIEDNQTVLRLGFVIVNTKQRGKGIGKEMVNLAVQYAFDFVKVRKVTLGVFENNPAAMHCYKACGFKESVPPQNKTFSMLGETWNSIELEITKQDVRGVM